MDWWITIIASLLSGLFGSLITTAINNKKEAEREKVGYKKYVFQNLIAFRGDATDNYPSSGNFVLNLNQVFIAFNDNKKVLTAFENYRKDMSTDALITLLKEMAKDIGIDYQFANDDLFLRPLLDVKLQKAVQQR